MVSRLHYGKPARRCWVAAYANDGLYRILGVPSSASQQEIKSAYKRLVHTLHPDKHHQKKVDTTAAFLKCKLAYEILSDSQKRDEYDQHLSGTYQVVMPQEHTSTMRQQWNPYNTTNSSQPSMNSSSAESNAGAWRNANATASDPATAAAAVAAAANSSGLSASARGYHPGSTTHTQRGHAALVPSQLGSSTPAGSGLHSEAAAVRSALLQQHSVALEQFSSMQEALEFLEQLDQQQNLLGLAVEDYGSQSLPGSNDTLSCDELWLKQGFMGSASSSCDSEAGLARSERWGNWHPGRFAPSTRVQQQGGGQ